MSQNSTTDEVVAALEKFKPQSIFLYGSRGRGDFRADSDYEVGAIFDDDKYVPRSEIHAAITNPAVKAYPFKWSQLANGTIDFLFQKSIYLREIALGGQTIAGENLITQIKPPAITTLDLLQAIALPKQNTSFLLACS